jgi:hypothetical protein
MALHRFTTHLQSVVVHTTAAGSQEILYSEYTSGEVFIPTDSPITTLTWHAAPVRGGTYLPAQDYSGVAVTHTVAQTKSYPIPLSLIGSVALKVVGNVAGTIDISLKS